MTAVFSGVHLTGKPSDCCDGSNEWQGLQVFSGVHLTGKPSDCCDGSNEWQ